MQLDEPSPDSLRRHLKRLVLPTLVALTTVALNYESVEAQLQNRFVVTPHKPESITYNSQSLPLLKPGAQTNAEPLPVEEGAYVAETGPLGVSYDTTPGGVISKYVVRNGDTIETIAKLHGVSKNTVIWANNIQKGAKISPGQQLIILPVSGVRYIVKQNGEKVEAIAKTFNGDANEVAEYNDLALSVGLAKGTEVIIPDGEVASTPEKKTVPKTTTTKATLVAEVDDEHEENDEDENTSVNPVKLATRVSVALLKDVTGYFMVPLKSGTRTQKIHGFNGIDLGAPVGTPIYAAASGKVVLIKGGNAWNGGYGNYIVIEHDNGTQTLYAHNSKNLVVDGQTISKGDKIALVGNTGRSTGPHLHFEVRGGKNPFAN